MNDECRNCGAELPDDWVIDFDYPGRCDACCRAYWRNIDNRTAAAKERRYERNE